MKESEHQKLIFKWAKTHSICCDYLFAIPNGGTRNIKEAVNMKAQGVRKGVSDLFLAYPVGHLSGLWIELKKDTKCSLSKEQVVWIERMKLIGYAAEVAYGFKDTVQIIRIYLKGALLDIDEIDAF